MEPKVFVLILSFLICSFLGAAAVLLMRSLLERRGARIRQRLDDDDQPPPLELTLEPDFSDRPGLMARFEGWFYRLIGQSGMTLSPDAAMLMAVACGLVLCGVLLLWRDDFLAAAVGLVAGIGMVIFYYMYRRGKRRLQMQEQLPELMETLARAVRAGQSLDQAIELVAQTADQPLGPEFRRCSAQLNMGLSINAAMRAMLRRAPLSEIRILASTLIMQRRTGGSLPVMLERLSNVVRDRINYHRQFRAATAAGRVSTTLIGVAGPLVAAYMLIWQREYFDRFFTSMAGQVLLATAVALQVVGLLWIYALLRSDY